MDKQGRIILPKEVRQALGINEDAELVCRVVGNRIVLERFFINSIKNIFEELEEIVPSIELDTVKVEEEDKYVDREYVLRKIGFRSAD
ncbi:MAG: AbrB/MazE/SpoVT family DNA-binding domain-containing protein [Nitrososphaeria archaeon]